MELSNRFLRALAQMRAAAAPPPSPEVIARRIRLEVALPDGTTTAQRDHVIAVVVDELSRA
jgi:hypothetical protein